MAREFCTAVFDALSTKYNVSKSCNGCVLSDGVCIVDIALGKYDDVLLNSEDEIWGKIVINDSLHTAWGRSQMEKFLARIGKTAEINGIEVFNETETVETPIVQVAPTRKRRRETFVTPNGGKKDKTIYASTGSSL